MSDPSLFFYSHLYGLFNAALLFVFDSFNEIETCGWYTKEYKTAKSSDNPMPE